MHVRKIVKFESDTGHDVEFVPSREHHGVLEVWVDGVYVESLKPGERVSEARALYYFEVHCPELEESMVRSSSTPDDDAPGLDASPVH